MRTCVLIALAVFVLAAKPLVAEHQPSLSVASKPAASRTPHFVPVQGGWRNTGANALAPPNASIAPRHSTRTAPRELPLHLTAETPQVADKLTVVSHREPAPPAEFREPPGHFQPIKSTSQPGPPIREPRTPACSTAGCGAGSEYSACDCCVWHCQPNESRLHVRVEHLQWWSSGMNLPPLVSFSPPGTPVNQAGVLGVPGNRVLYGQDEVFDRTLAGGRYTASYWWDDCEQTGIELEYFTIFHDDEAFLAGSATDIVSRPFVNALSGLEDAELVSFPNLLEGTVSVDAHTELHSAAARLRFDIYRCNSHPGLDIADRSFFRWYAFVGYRYMQLEEDVTIREDLTDPAPPTTDFDIRDHFDAENRFHGGEFGLAGEFADGRWSLDIDARLSLGSHRQKVHIAGDTVITTFGIPQAFTGGLLTQVTNIGTHKRNEFSVIPEFGASVGYRLHENVRLVVGYRLLFWPDVVRPGDQIDRVVNPNLLAPSTPPVPGPERPRFEFHETDFLAQALSLGCEFNW